MYIYIYTYIYKKQKKLVTSGLASELDGKTDLVHPLVHLPTHTAATQHTASHGRSNTTVRHRTNPLQSESCRKELP